MYFGDNLRHIRLQHQIKSFLELLTIINYDEAKLIHEFN